MSEYKALTYINLPLLDIKKAPGDTITDEEFEQGGQTQDDIDALLSGGSISSDLNAPLHPDNEPVPPPTTTTPGAVDVVTDDIGKGISDDG